MWFDDESGKELIKLLLAELLGHRCDAQQLFLIRIVSGIRYDRSDCYLIGVLTVASAFDQFEAGIADSGQCLLQRVGLDVLGPGYQNWQ